MERTQSVDLMAREGEVVCVSLETMKGTLMVKDVQVSVSLPGVFAHVAQLCFQNVIDYLLYLLHSYLFHFL